MATKTDIELKIVDSVGTSHTEAEVLTDSASNPDAFYVSRGYLAHNGEKVIEGIDPNGSYPNMTVGNAQKAKKAEKATHADTATDLSGRVEATPEVFTYRPSAGEKSIKDDNAFIRRVKGNSVVWNQLVEERLINNNGITLTSNNGVITLSGTPTTTWFNVTTGIPVVLGHKMLLQLFVVANPNNIDVDFGDLHNRAIISSLTGGGTIYEVSGQTTHWLAFNDPNLTNIDFTGYQICLMYTDLTAMFDAGNEPDTVEKFRALYPDSSYPYNTGELRNLDCSGIKTVGFNQWDEQWESGVYRYWSDGQKSDNSEYIRSANFIRVIPAKTYCLNIAAGVDAGVGFYDENNNFLGQASFSYNNNSRLFQVPANCQKITFYTKATTYNNNICINLSHTGVRDGEYKPYKEATHGLPLSQITNGEPLRKAGSVYDEINETHYIKRVGTVDLGSLSWSQNPSYGFYVTIKELPKMQNVTGNDIVANIFCAKYTAGHAVGIFTQAKTNSIAVSTTHLVVGDLTYNTVNDFKSAMSGVLLNYELAEPIVTPIETPIDFNYYVEDFGTEEALLAEDSAPFSADIVYQFNATDQIRNNTRNIHKLQKSAFTPSGTSAQYIRGDGSYGDRVELSQSTPINDGEYEMPDEGDYDMQFTLSPSYYAKSPRELDDTTTIAVFVTAPEDSYHLAEYWFEFAVGETLPNIEYYQPNNSEAVFRIDGDMMTYAVNILHLISSDGGETFFGEIKNYVL